jgi:hypothetical protein
MISKTSEHGFGPIALFNDHLHHFPFPLLVYASLQDDTLFKIVATVVFILYLATTTTLSTRNVLCSP